MSKKYNCKNVGCCETFSWSMQVASHRAKCQYPEPVMSKKYSLNDGKYRCAKCSKEFLHQNSFIHLSMLMILLSTLNVIRHMICGNN